jgi:hypothetical protein
MKHRTLPSTRRRIICDLYVGYLEDEIKIIDLLEDLETRGRDITKYGANWKAFVEGCIIK